MGNIPACAKETFLILKGFDLTSTAYNEEGNVVFDPEEARRIFIKKINMLIAFVEDDDSVSMRVYLGQNIDINSIKELRDRLRITANKFSLLFHIREFGKVISPKDFATPVSVTENKRIEMNITEGLYGTSKSSYLKLENARMIVRHKSRINENALGSRGRNIEAIFIENGAGERILFPTTNLAPARAMTSHVDQGGNWADTVGQQITSMAKDFSALAAASRHIYLFGGNLDESAGDLRQTIREQISDLRRVFEGICRKTRYKTICDAIENHTSALNESTDLNEKVGAMTNLLNSGDHALNETIIETVVRVLEDGNRFKLPHEPRENKPKDELIGVLGRKVSLAAWNQFKKKATIELYAKPDVSNAPSHFSDKKDKLSFYAGALAEQCKDDSFGNLLAFISDRLPEERDQNVAKNMKTIATLALRYAGVDVSNVINTQEVREFVEWVDSFNASKVLSEDWYEPSFDRAGEEKADAVLDYLYSSYDPSDFIEWLGYGEPADAGDLNKDDIMRLLENYLNEKAVGEGAASDLICDDLARQLYPKTKDALEASGYVFDIMEDDCFGCLDEDDELTTDDISRDDILLPKNQEDSLFDQTTTDSEHSDEYLNRIQALAGVSPLPFGVSRTFI